MSVKFVHTGLVMKVNGGTAPNSPPTVIYNGTFESGVIDELAKNTADSMSSTVKMYFTADQVHAGAQAARNEVTLNGTTYGGTIVLPTPLVKGQELWYRSWWWYPAHPDWQFAVGDGAKGLGIKTMRNHLGSAYVGALIQYDVDGDNMLKYGNENDTVYFNAEPGGNGPNPLSPIIGRETWNYFETYMYVTDTRIDTTGGRDGVNSRFWCNGYLCRESGAATLEAPGDALDNIVIGNFWNGAGPQDQTCYNDDILLVTANPPNVDDAGNPMIGTWSP